MDVANAQPDRRRLKSVMAERLSLSPGARVLDVGCGTGGDAHMLASLVGSDGHVIGIDASETMISVARERSQASSLPVQFADYNIAAPRSFNVLSVEDHGILELQLVLEKAGTQS